MHWHFHQRCASPSRPDHIPLIRSWYTPCRTLADQAFRDGAARTAQIDRPSDISGVHDALEYELPRHQYLDLTLQGLTTVPPMLSPSVMPCAKIRMFGLQGVWEVRAFAVMPPREPERLEPEPKLPPRPPRLSRPSRPKNPQSLAPLKRDARLHGPNVAVPLFKPSSPPKRLVWLPMPDVLEPASPPKMGWDFSDRYCCWKSRRGESAGCRGRMRMTHQDGRGGRLGLNSEERARRQ